MRWAKPRYGGRSGKWGYEDRLWGDIVKIRDGYICRRCGRSKAQGWVIDAMHVFGRTRLSVRFDVEDGLAGCKVCHDWFDAHKSTTHDGEADRWARAQIGEAAWQRLLVRAQLTIRPNREAIRMMLREELKRLTARVADTRTGAS